ncbi:MAG: quinone-interacting membrane-bound oxidoreductase complex subunit QmoC, partial [Candidatus Sumerlaeia bacterium]|nr:quinone-interacting membrane-bound oxidoreductase complex subunit QmoC [Candidatus Sumerlaeia bacterium]
MAEPILIEPDLQFKRRLLADNDTLKKCFQCGTCTVACPLSPDTEPFPRKEVLWAQWGLKDRLMADPDVWMCHQCNDCAQLCPRGANPGDVLAAVRQQVVEHYAVPGVFARMVASPKWLPVLFAIPAVLMGLAIWATGGFSAKPEGSSHFFATGIFLPDGQGFKQANFDHFFAHYPIIIFFTAFIGLAMLGALAGLVRYWKAMDARAGGRRADGNPGLIACAVETIKEILLHKKFTQCEATANRYWGHLLLFYGFGAMFLTTCLAALAYYTIGYPFMSLWHPVKLLGNLGGVVFLAGLAIVIAVRLRGGKLAPASGYNDWLFLAVMGLTVVTGMICQAARLVNAPIPAYGWYFVHLLFVFFLPVYLPSVSYTHLTLPT